jgi:hypothetical protein
MTDAILELLAEEGMSDEAELSSFLVVLRAEATSIHPMPSEAVAELMPLRPTRASRSALGGRRRIVTGLIVLGSLGVGVGAAAASPDIRSGAQHIAQTVIGTIGSVVGPSLPPPVTHRPSSVPGPSSTAGAPMHPTAKDHPGNSGNGQTGAAPGRGGDVPPSSRDKESPPAHPDPAPSHPGQSHHP